MDHGQLDLYRKVAKMTASPREMEAMALTNGALKLKECVDNWESQDSKIRLAEALHFNQQIWSIFQADLTSKECRLPRELRLNLLKLGAFVDRQIFAMMAHPSPEKLVSIIEVNLSLAAGLREKQEIARETQAKMDDHGRTKLEIKG
jgi:flagellar biosynthesis activator protein FlaF